MNNLIKIFFLSVRPKTLLVGGAPVILGYGISKQYIENLNVLTFFVCVTCTILMQMGTNLVNDYYDYQRGVDGANRIGPERFASQGKNIQQFIKRSFVFCFLASLIMGSFLIFKGGLLITILGVFSILIAYCYTGGPLPLSHYALGEVLAFIFFGPVAVIGTVYLQTKHYDSLILLQSCAPGFLAAALMSINNLRDISTDSSTNKKTLALILGNKNAVYLSIILINIHLIISILNYLNYNNPLFLFPFIINLLFISKIKIIFEKPVTTKINQTLGITGAINLLYCIGTSLIFYYQ